MPEIITTDATGIENLDEIVSYLKQHITDTDQVSHIYLTPSANWSDYCEHKPHHTNFKCHINGAAYMISPKTPLKKLICSSDFYGEVSFYKITSFGEEVDAVFKNPKSSREIAELSEKIESHLKSKLHDISAYTRHLFSTLSGKTMKPVVYSEIEVNQGEIESLKKSPMKIGCRNGFVGIIKRSFDQNASVSENNSYYLVVRSYDEISGETLLDEIHKNDMTLGDFVSSEKIKRLKEDAKTMGKLHRDHVAFEILQRLGWKSKGYIKTVFFPRTNRQIHCQEPSKSLTYNCIRQFGNKFIYYDHCFNLFDVTEEGKEPFWPYFGSRLGSVFFVYGGEWLNPDEKWASRLFALPMGSRKLIHRSQYTTKTRRIHSDLLAFESESLPIVLYTRESFGPEFSYKITQNKYQATLITDLKSWLKKTYSMSFEVIEYTIQYSAFGNEFHKDFSGTLNIIDRVLLTEGKGPVVISMEDEWVQKNLSLYFIYHAKRGKQIKDVIQQDTNCKYVMFQHQHLVAYLEDIK